jgi:AcrR family transcriptional regulator
MMRERIVFMGHASDVAASVAASTPAPLSAAPPGAVPAPSRDRILAAARDEFAARGFAGGRVDRIAAAATINKERLYAYFGGKEGLFVEAMAAAIREIGVEVSREARDLPDLAGRMFDFIGAHPGNLRLLTWARLESDSMWEKAHNLIEAELDPVEIIEGWQATGRIDEAWEAHDLFIAILGLCEIWHITPFVADNNEAVAERRRALVVHIATSLSASNTDVEH